MRMMETIRRKGQWFLWSFLIIFTITLFFGLTGGFDQNPFQSRGPSPTSSSKSPGLVENSELKGTAMLVNGRKVSNNVFDQTYRYVMDRFRQQGGSADSPEMALYGYGSTVQTLTGQEVIMARGEELGINLTDADLRKAKTEAAASFLEQGEDKSGGNVVGDIVGKLGDLREQKAAFSQYLQTQGMTEDEWVRSAHRSLYATKVQDELQKTADEAKKAASDKLKGEIDAQLSKGMSFADAAKKYSDGPNKEDGGDMDWLGRGLVDKKIADAMMAAQVGKTTDWLEIPAGWQRFEVLEKKEAKGAEFDKAKPGLIKAIQDEKKQPDYKPTDDDLKNQYEKARVRVIELHNTDQESVSDQITKLIDSAVVEINNPYALAYQALYDSKLQPPADMGFDGLVKLAKGAPVGDAYDFELIKKKLAAGAPKAKQDDKPADKKDEADKDAAADAPAKDEGKTPIYALAIGLLNTAIEAAGNDQAADYPYYMASKAYIDWLKDEENAKTQPVQRDKARAELDRLLQRVVKSNDYSAMAHAWRGLNLAWLEKKTEAEAELEKAMEYAPSEDGPVWQDIRKGFEVIDNQAKLTEVDAKLAMFRQEQLRKMIEQAQTQGQITGNNQLIKVEDSGGK